MFYIVALGNPGSEYKNTRHNVGWFLADQLRELFSFTEPVFSAKYQGKISQGMIGQEEVTLLYPETFMNNSGEAVLSLIEKDFFTKTLVLHDDIALPLGVSKISVNRGDGGHNGVRSIIEATKTKNFVRFRIGIAPKAFLTGKTKVIGGERLASFVLGRFSKREQMTLIKMGETFSKIIEILITKGVAVAMNKYN